MRYDLHIHTAASDGSDSPDSLARKVVGAGLELFSVTDHDTVDGALAMEGLIPAGVGYIRGVEFSCVSPGGKCHILGYGFDPEHPAFRAALGEGAQLRQEKLENRIVHLREKFGIRLTVEEEQWLRSLKSPGKPHLGRLLVKRGLADELSAAIKTYLSGVPGRDRIDSKTAIDAILAAGGIPVWAHPLGGEGEKRLSRAEFEHRLAVLMAEGIRGLECCYSRYGMDESELLLRCARERGLIATGGSDYHGSNKKGIKLGQLGTVSANWSIDTAPFSGIILQKKADRSTGGVSIEQ